MQFPRNNHCEGKFIVEQTAIRIQSRHILPQRNVVPCYENLLTDCLADVWISQLADTVLDREASTDQAPERHRQGC